MIFFSRTIVSIELNQNHSDQQIKLSKSNYNLNQEKKLINKSTIHVCLQWNYDLCLNFLPFHSCLTYKVVRGK